MIDWIFYHSELIGVCQKCYGSKCSLCQAVQHEMLKEFNVTDQGQINHLHCSIRFLASIFHVYFLMIGRLLFFIADLAMCWYIIIAWDNKVNQFEKYLFVWWTGNHIIFTSFRYESRNCCCASGGFDSAHENAFRLLFLLRLTDHIFQLLKILRYQCLKFQVSITNFIMLIWYIILK